MTVVWVNKRSWKNPGPITYVAVHNARAFAEVGCESHLVIGQGDPSDTTADLQEFYGVEPSAPFHVHRIPRFRVGGKTYSMSIFLAAFRIIRREAARHQVLVISRESGFLPFLAALHRRPRLRCLFELHDCYADLSWKETTPRFRERREQALERMFLPWIGGIVCITPEQRDLYRRVFPGVPSVAVSLGTRPRPPVDPERRRERRTIVYLGHPYRSKGLDVLWRTAKDLAARGIRILVWGGYPEGVRGLQRQAEAAGLGGAITFEPFKTPAAMHRDLAIQAALGVAVLSDTYYNRYLTSPVKALDYLSHGIPTIGTDLPSVRHLLGDAGVYIRPGDHAAFVEHASRLLDDPAAYRQATLGMRAQAQRLTWDRRARTILAFAESAGRPSASA